MDTLDFGRKGEKYAAQLLLKNGYRILEMNFRKPWGEIDIVAVKDNVLVFVEVKARKTDIFGLPEEAVTPRKLGKIIRVAELYMQIHPELPKKARIDVVSILVINDKVVREKIIQVDGF